jgi:replicative DNA helicase
VSFDYFDQDDAPDAPPPPADDTAKAVLAPAAWAAGPQGWVKPGDTGTLPHNLEAEQALLGPLMFDRETIWQLPDDFGPESFYEPYHGRVFAICRRQIEAGMSADPTMMTHQFEGDPAYEGSGGFRYLVDLVDRAPPSATAASYGRIIHDLALRRQLMEAAASIFWGANDMEQPAQTHLEAAETHLLSLRSLSPGVDMIDAQAASQMVFDHLDADEASLGGVLSGLGPLDKAMGPEMPGELTLTAGRPGMGKSTLAAVKALNAARPDLVLLNPNLSERDRQELHLTMPAPVGVLFISGEMAVKQSTWRLLAGVAFQLYGDAAPTYSAIKKRRVTPEQRDMLEEARRVWDSSNIMQVRKTGIKMASIRSMAKRLSARWHRQGIKLGKVIIDHGGLIRPDNERLSEYEGQSQIARDCKQLAGDLGVPVEVLLQLSRKTEDREDKRPQLSDLRSSGQWEENADTVLLTYREAYYAKKEKEPIVGKGLDADAKWLDWDRRRKSKALAVILAKTRDTDGGEVELWADMGHHAVLGQEPQSVGGFDFDSVPLPSGSGR